MAKESHSETTVLRISMHIGECTEGLDRLDAPAYVGSVTMREVVEKLGHHSFAALVPFVSLISAPSASAIPGITATAGVILLLLALQTIFGLHEHMVAAVCHAAASVDEEATQGYCVAAQANAVRGSRFEDAPHFPLHRSRRGARPA